MNRLRRWLPPADVLLAGGFILLLATAFWKWRIFDRGTDPTMGLGPVDLYIEIIPTLEYGYAMLKAGHFPLWNPYQLCGEPFFAIGWTGLLYPPHWIRLFVDILVSIEIMLVFHLFWGGFGMWLLARQVGIGAIGGLCAAMTFMWSGWMTLNNTQPPVVEALSWLPFIVLLLDRLALGRRFAWLWLIVAVACQLLIGLMEIFVHTVYVAALFFSFRLVQVAWHGNARAAVRRAALAAVCMIAAVLVAAPLLLPTIELSQQSTRAAGQLSIEQVIGWGGTIAPAIFLRNALDGRGVATIGVLPLVALPLALSLRRGRVIAIASATAATLAALLVFGSRLFELYYQVPVLGSLFRRPMKFLSLYGFGQALLGGMAVTRLGELADASESTLWRRPVWAATLLLGVAGLWWLAHLGAWNGYLTALVALLLLFGLINNASLRTAILVALCAIQGASLFSMVGDTHVRPMRQPEIYHRQDFVYDWLQKTLGDARIYLSPHFVFDPALTSKQGQMRRMAVSIDYEPLATNRYAKFFDRVTIRKESTPFAGGYYLNPESRWRLLDLTGTKFFFVPARDPVTAYMSRQPADFRFVMGSGNVRIFARTTVLPRAYFVARSRTLPDADAVLEALDQPEFDPRKEVLLEDPVSEAAVEADAGGSTGDVRIALYEPERVVLALQSERAGFVVLGDLHYPGWKAYLDGREVPILRANYLFRAVQVAAGNHDLRFEYRPASFRLGLLVSACTLLGIAAVVAWSRR